MGNKTSISWTEATVNTVMGCRKVDTDPRTGACYNCYIFRDMPKWGRNPGQLTYTNLDNVKRNLVKWDKRLVFLNDFSDTFHEDIPFETILRWHREIIEKLPYTEFQLLTKRIGRAMVFYRRYYDGRPPRNVWLGASIGAKNRLFRIEQLLKIGAKIRWVSFEPLLEDLGEFSLKGIDWVVVGGESGFNPRPMKPEWAENIRRIAERDGAAFYFKQMGGFGGNGAGGDLLNGRQYHNFPVVTQNV